jgi:hypothetical protein
MLDASKSPLNPQLGFSQLMDGPNSSDEVAPTLSGSYKRPAAYVATESPVESLSDTDSVFSTASDYLVRSAPLFESAVCNFTVPQTR